MGNYNFKRFIQILGGTFIATFIIIGLLRGHYGQLYIQMYYGKILERLCQLFQ